MSAPSYLLHSDLDVVRAALDADYEVLEEIGRGAMAVVYRARERQLNRDVAVKVLPFDLVSDAEGVERFQREARTAAQLEHPHIVPIYRVGRSGRVIFFTMKLLSAESLSARLARHGRLPVSEVRRVLSETALALGYAATHGIVHRDVKPDNIMLDGEGRCVVTDFGIARAKGDADLTAAGISIGTPRYMSPEQARGKHVDGRSDIYSLGVVGYHCLTGTVPFSGDDAVGILVDHVQSPVPRPALTSSEERALYAVIERMLEKDPGDRFQSTDELLAALENDGEGIATDSGSSMAQTDAGATAALYAGADNSGPRPSAALDKALAVGIQLLREQEPRVKAGIAAGTRFAQAHAPHIRSAADQLVRTAGGGAARASARARAMSPRFWYLIAGVTILSFSSWYGARFALKHRSRCPAVAEADAGLDAAMKPPVTRRSSLLIDEIGSDQQGDLDVYYDVCGLEKGTSFRTRISVVKTESGLRRLLGSGVPPVTESFDESANGPATRRHRTLSFDAMPAGAYTLFVSVTDAGGKRQTKDIEFQRVGQ